MFPKRLGRFWCGMLLFLLVFFGQGRAIAQQPKQRSAEEIQLILEGNQACKEGNYQKGVFAYQRALSKFDSADASFNLGVTYEVNLQDRVQAIYYYRKFLQLEPDSGDARHVRQWVKEIQLYLEHRPAPEKQPPASQAPPAEPVSIKAKVKPRSLDKVPPQLASLARQHLKDGNLAAMQGNYQQAIISFQKVLDIYESADAYYNLGLIYAQKLKQNEQAVTYYQKYLELEPGSPQAKEIKAWLKGLPRNE